MSNCKACGQPVTDATAAIELPKRVMMEFKVFGVSKNTNSFGLTGMFLVSRKGTTFEVAVSTLHLRRVDDIVRIPVSTFDGMIESTPEFFFEIPEAKPDCPAEILKKIWAVKEAQQC